MEHKILWNLLFFFSLRPIYAQNPPSHLQTPPPVSNYLNSADQEEKHFFLILTEMVLFLKYCQKIETILEGLKTYLAQKSLNFYDDILKLERHHRLIKNTFINLLDIYVSMQSVQNEIVQEPRITELLSEKIEENRKNFIAGKEAIEHYMDHASHQTYIFSLIQDSVLQAFLQEYMENQQKGHARLKKIFEYCLIF